MNDARSHILAPVVLLALLAGTAWSYARLSDAREGAEASAGDEADCRRIIGRIDALRRRPAMAGAREIAVTELTARIEAAAKSSECPANSIIRIDPEPARRVSETAYLESPTQVLLRNLSLRQAVTFLHALAAGETALRVGALKLSGPPGDEGSDRWQLECTLSYLVYSPRGEGSIVRN